MPKTAPFIPQYRFPWQQPVKEKPIPENITQQILHESKLIAEFMGLEYAPYEINWQSKTSRLGWHDKNYSFVCRTTRELPFYTNINELNKVCLKIQKSGYIFEFGMDKMIEKLMLCVNKEDKMIGRALRDNIWNECIEYLRIYANKS